MNRLNLTERELEALRLKGIFARDADVAKAMGTKTHTVKKQLRWARIKLGARNTAHAYALAFRKGLL